MDPLIISIGFLSIALIILAIWIVILERRINRLLSGKSGESLEGTIAQNSASIQELFHFRDEMKAELSKLDARIKTKIQGARTKRFNPFAGTGTGGNQSFATALLDETGNGVVLSTLYSREKVSIFAKPIKNRESEFELTEEEKEVLR
jgi:hypothetical protein